MRDWTDDIIFWLISSIVFSSKVFSIDCNLTLKANDFLSCLILSPSYTSKISILIINSGSQSLTAEISSLALIFLSTIKAKSLSTAWNLETT